MVTKDNILEIIKDAGKQSLSIYMPTHEKGNEVQQDPIRLKNLLNKAEDRLADRGLSTIEIEELLHEPRKLLDKPRFWQYSDKGLALFITENIFTYYRVPLEFKERLLIDNHFLITPLLPMITLEGTFCILAISQKRMRLLKATRDTVVELPMRDTPTSMEEFTKYDVTEKNLSSASGAGGTKSMFHGWGDASIEDKAVENYLKRIENEVTSILRKRRDPLILTGVDEAISIYRKVNHYDRVMENAIKGNPDPKTDDDLKDEGWTIIKDYFLQEMYNDIERYGDLTGSEMQSENLSKIVEGAYYGKIESLFVPIGEHSWGRFDAEKDMVYHSAERQNGEHDLINVAAIKTLANGGNVYALRKDEMPNNAPIAAIFRY